MLTSRALRRESKGVRCLRVFVGDPSITEPWRQWTVVCPRRGRVSLETCVDCPRFVGLRVLSGPGLTLVACHADEPRLEAVKSRPSGVASPSTKVRSLLAPDVLCLSPELGIDEVITMLVAKSLDHAPIVDEASRPIGLVSKADLMHWYWQGPGKTRKSLRDVMRPLLAISDDSVAADAAQAMWSNGVECIAVVSAKGRFEGLLSAVDLLPCLLAGSAANETQR